MIKTWFLGILKSVSIIFVIAFPAIIIYGYFSPWDVSEKTLSKYENNIILLVGIKHKIGSVNGVTFDRKSRTYIIVDEKFNSRTITVFAEFDVFINAEVKEGGLLKAVLWYLVIIVIFWYFWLTPHNKQRNADSGASAPPPVR